MCAGRLSIQSEAQFFFTAHYLGDGAVLENLCLQSNDPVNPVFPLYLRITEQP